MSVQQVIERRISPMAAAVLWCACARMELHINCVLPNRVFARNAQNSFSSSLSTYVVFQFLSLKEVSNEVRRCEVDLSCPDCIVADVPILAVERGNGRGRTNAAGRNSAGRP